MIRKAAKSDEPARIPAHDLEAAVIERILEFLKSPRELLKTMKHPGDMKGNYSELLKQASEKGETWTAMPAQQRARFIKAVIQLVIIHPDEVEISIYKNALLQQLAGRARLASAALS